MITLYHQTKTPISFWCRRGLNPRSLIQPSETLQVELTGTHIYGLSFEMFVSQKNNAYGLNLQLMLLKTIAINAVIDHNVVIWGTAMGWQFMFAGRVRVVLSHEYSAI